MTSKQNMQAEFFRQRHLMAMFPFSSATLWRRVKEGTFPKPIKLGPRMTAWRAEDIRAFMAELEPNP